MPTTIFPIEPTPAFAPSILNQDALEQCWKANYEVQCGLIESFRGDVESGYTVEYGYTDVQLDYVAIPATPEEALAAVAEWLPGRGGWGRAALTREQALIQYRAYLATFIQEAASDERYAAALKTAERWRGRWSDTLEQLAGLPHFSQLDDAQYAKHEQLRALEPKQARSFTNAAVTGFQRILG